LRSQRRSKRNREGTAFQYCGTFAHREELSENTRGTAGMVRSGVKRKQEEERRNSVPVLRNIRSLSENTRGTAGMAVSRPGVQQKQEDHRRNSVPVLRNIRSQRRTVREHSRNGWNGCEQIRSEAEARGTQKEQRSNTAEHSLTAKNCQRTLAERLECL